MQFAVSYNTAFHGVDPYLIVAHALHAEACGFEALYLPEHIVLYPGAMIGPNEIPPTLSKGRMRRLTVGVGTLAPEAESVGVDFRTRGRRADEAIDVLRLLWSGGEDGVSFHGEFFRFDNLCSYPKPHGTTALPIHIGGSSTAAARRAGRRGDGYFPGGALMPDERARQWEIARSAAIEAGRDPDALEYTQWGSIDLSPERVQAYTRQGVTRIVVSANAADPQQQHDQLSAFAERFGLGRGA